MPHGLFADTTEMHMTVEERERVCEENRSAWLHCMDKHAFASNRQINMKVQQYGWGSAAYPSGVGGAGEASSVNGTKCVRRRGKNGTVSVCVCTTFLEEPLDGF